MDYDVFFDEVKAWIKQCNVNAVEKGMHSVEFWEWVSMSIADICDRYQNDELVKRQMLMLYQWLNDLYSNMNKVV